MAIDDTASFLADQHTLMAFICGQYLDGIITRRERAMRIMDVLETIAARMVRDFAILTIPR